MTFDLPPLALQADRLISLGLHDRAGVMAKDLKAAEGEGLLVLAVPPSVLVPLVEWQGKAGFVVADMTDLDRFAPIDGLNLPDAPFYVLDGLERGDEMANWSPDEALPAILAAGRTPLTALEGIFWLLQNPAVLERNRCFMTIGSRLRRPDGRLDARTPALWISNGTGRDGAARRDAAKVGWCWAGNRHTWLGFASAKRRVAC
ncbi:MAG: DUF5701 family protein [Sporichthyaceae bacterium]